MEKDFCQALIDDDRKALQPVVNAFLSTINPRENYAANMDKVKAWVASHDCIEKVEISTELLDTDPPVQQLKVTYAGKNNTIGIVLRQEAWAFNIK
ncbi:MAG: hypothetical protein LCH81_02665 [Bacteroidetes bacterium]|nr:hypothetical protein [Bacteroidota bacterium]